jgi:GxxExxY protein
MNSEQITYRIIACAITVHKALGPGLLESAYQISLEHELNFTGLQVESQKILPLTYNGIRTKKGYRVDFLVEKKVIVEVKSARQITLLDEAQVHTYLKLLNCRVGLLINFNTRWVKTGLHRIINPLCVETKEVSAQKRSR